MGWCWGCHPVPESADCGLVSDVCHRRITCGWSPPSHSSMISRPLDIRISSGGSQSAVHTMVCMRACVIIACARDSHETAPPSVGSPPLPASPLPAPTRRNATRRRRTEGTWGRARHAGTADKRGRCHRRRRRRRRRQEESRSPLSARRPVAGARAGEAQAGQGATPCVRLWVTLIYIYSDLPCGIVRVKGFGSSNQASRRTGAKHRKFILGASRQAGYQSSRAAPAVPAVQSLQVLHQHQACSTC